MARIRSIKPDFWTDEKIVDLDFHERLLFIGLWNFADDQGYLDYSPRRIKMQVFPGDSIDVSGALARLHEHSLIEAYDGPDGVVLHLTNWSKHQRVSNPARERFQPSDLRKRNTLTDAVDSPPEDSRVLGKGREGSKDFSSEVADAPSDPQSEDEPPAEEAREDVERVCLHLAEVMVANGCRRPTVSKKWRTEARLMIDKDGREPDKIIRAIDWAWADSFWKGKIESIPKLRVQYDKLRLQAQTSKSNVHVADFGAPDPKRTYAPDDVRGRWQS